MELEQLRRAHAALLAQHSALETSHSELLKLYAEAIAEKERSVEENSKLWRQFKHASPKKSRQNSAGSSTASPRRAAATAAATPDRLDAGTPPNLHAPTGNLTHSPFARNSSLDDERFPSPRPSKPSISSEPIVTPTLPLRIHSTEQSSVSQIVVLNRF